MVGGGCNSAGADIYRAEAISAGYWCRAIPSAGARFCNWSVLASSCRKDEQNGISFVTTLQIILNLNTLVHELVHAVDDCKHGHGKEFQKLRFQLSLREKCASARRAKTKITLYIRKYEKKIGRILTEVLQIGSAVVNVSEKTRKQYARYVDIILFLEICLIEHCLSQR